MAVTDAERHELARSVEQLHLAAALRAVNERMGAIEESLNAGNKKPARTSGETLLEVIKLLVGGWPAFGLVLLVLFYEPLRDTLAAIPIKVRAAEELQLPGVSLKSTISKEATKIGAAQLSKTIPTLSQDAIAMLLRAPRQGSGTVTYTPTDDGRGYRRLTFFADAAIDGIAELVSKGLVEATHYGTDSRPPASFSGEWYKGSLRAFKAAHPGTFEQREDPWVYDWIPATPVPRSDPIPGTSWSLTQLGVQAVTVIVAGLAEELAPASGGERASAAR